MNNEKNVLLSFINDDLNIDQMFIKYLSLKGDRSEINRLILQSGLDELYKFIDFNIYFGDQICNKYEFHILNIMYNELFSLISKKDRKNILIKGLCDVNNITFDKLGFTARITEKDKFKYGKNLGKLIISKSKIILNGIIYPLVQLVQKDINYLMEKMESTNVDNLFKLVTFDVCKIQKNKSNKDYYIIELL